MNRITITAVLFLISTVAHATPPFFRGGGAPFAGNEVNAFGGNATALGGRAVSNASATGIGLGLGFGGEGGGGGSGGAGGAGFGGSGGAGGNGFGGSVNSPRFASMAYAPPAYPTATCLKAYSGGGSWIGAGFSAGVTVVDTECRIFEGMRAIVNASNNGMLTQTVEGETIAARMLMDITCEADTTRNTRDCIAHNKMRKASTVKQAEAAPEEDTELVKIEETALNPLTWF